MKSPTRHRLALRRQGAHHRPLHEYYGNAVAPIPVRLKLSNPSPVSQKVTVRLRAERCEGGAMPWKQSFTVEIPRNAGRTIKLSISKAARDALRYSPMSPKTEGWPNRGPAARSRPYSSRHRSGPGSAKRHFSISTSVTPATTISRGRSDIKASAKTPDISAAGPAARSPRKTCGWCRSITRTLRPISTLTDG
jgi:hypothetical protein